MNKPNVTQQEPVNPTCFTLYPSRLVQQGFRDGGTPRKTIIRLHIFWFFKWLILKYLWNWLLWKSGDNGLSGCMLVVGICK